MNKYSIAVQKLCVDWDNEREEFKRRVNAPDKHGKCKIANETECGLSICCFECHKKVQCEDFTGICGDYDSKTFKQCEERVDR